MKYNPIDIARQFLFVREAKEANTGLRVESIQHWCGGNRGESWCCYFATMVLDICFQGHAPIEREGACQDVYALAKAEGWMTTTPAPNDLFIYVTDADHAHHIGFVTEWGKGIAGNTNDGGNNPNGDGVYEHSLNMQSPHVKFIRYPR